MQLVELITQTLVTFLVVIDPIGLTAMFMAITAGHSQAERKHYALKGVAVAAVVLCIFALGGDFLLASLGISLAAFRIAGGVLLFMVAIDMLFVKHTGLSSTTDSEEAEARKKEDVSVFPLAIPLIAGPGAIASVLLLMTEVQGNLQSQTIVVALLLAVLLFTLILLLVSAKVLKIFGVTGINVIGRVLGMLLAALAVQFIIDGVLEVYSRS